MEFPNLYLKSTMGHGYQQSNLLHSFLISYRLTFSQGYVNNINIIQTVINIGYSENSSRLFGIVILIII